MKPLLFLLVLTVLAAFGGGERAFAQQQTNPFDDLPIEGDAERQHKKQQDEADARAVDKAQREAAGTQLPLLKGTREERLETLFETLRTTKNKQLGRRAERAIQKLWTQSGSDTIDLLLAWATEAISKKQYGAALDYLDNIIRLKPGFAEGWNLRATVYFLKQDFDQSIADVERTLQLEPRHFGALAGLGIMLMDYGQRQNAHRVLKRALEINPTMKQVQDTLKKLQKALEDRKI